MKLEPDARGEATTSVPTLMRETSHDDQTTTRQSTQSSEQVVQEHVTHGHEETMQSTRETDRVIGVISQGTLGNRCTSSARGPCPSAVRCQRLCRRLLLRTIGPESLELAGATARPSRRRRPLSPADTRRPWLCQADALIPPVSVGTEPGGRHVSQDSLYCIANTS